MPEFRFRTNTVYLADMHMKIRKDFLRFFSTGKFTAVFASNDMIAMQVMHMLRANGYPHPRRLSP